MHRVAAILLIMAMHGCASREELVEQDIHTLTQNEAEARALTQFAHDNPEIADHEMLSTYLEGLRKGRAHRQALAIELRRQHPEATDEEIRRLVDEQVRGEGAPDDDDMLLMK